MKPSFSSQKIRQPQNRLEVLRKQMWGEQSALVAERLEIIGTSLEIRGEKKRSHYYKIKRKELLDSNANPALCVRIFESLLLNFPETSIILQKMLNEDWKNIKTPEGASIFGYPNLTRPFGLGNGICTVPGFLPDFMRRLRNWERKKFGSGLDGTAGTCKPGTLIKTNAAPDNGRDLTRPCSSPLSYYYSELKAS